MWTLGGIIALLLVALTSGFLGYYQGIRLRTQAADSQVAQRLAEQFLLGSQELAEGQYHRARQRFEYIIRIDPNYPGVTEKMAEVLIRLNTIATETPAPTPTEIPPTPTPDTRGIDELYSQGQQSLQNGNWTEAIDTLLQLRKNDPTYHPVEIDGMLFIALRNRGKDKILRDGDLEGGIYDLALAERFGPLDVEAQGFQTWARLYITGASFWGINWAEAVNYFSQVAPQTPNLRDGSGWTATERYRLSSIHLAQQYYDAGDACAAREQFDVALTMGALVDEKGQTYEEAYNESVIACDGGGGEESEEDSEEEEGE